MKQVLLFVLMFGFGQAFADSTAVETFLFNGLEESKEVNLTTEKTRTEYRTVRVPSTCYRREVRRICENRRPVCRRVCDRRGNCRRSCSTGGRICRNVVVNRPYRCMRTETRAVEVFDYFVETKVKFEFNNRNIGADAVKEQFSMRMTGERANLSVASSKNYLIVLDKELRSERAGNGVKNVDLTYKISLLPAQSSSRVLENGIRNVKLRNGILNFTLGAGFNLNDFSQQIRIFKNRRLGTDTLLLNKFLSENDANVQSTASGSAISIDLSSLGVDIPSKLRVILDTKYKIDENQVLNRNEVKLNASANWVFR